jgi:hypothetical protein
MRQFVFIEKSSINSDGIENNVPILHLSCGTIILRVNDPVNRDKTECLQEYLPIKDELVDMCLNWNDKLAYDYDIYIKPMYRKSKIDKILI